MNPPAVKPPRRAVNPERQAHRREQILDGATEVFAEFGYPDTDMQVIADRLQVGKGTLYRYFPSKRELFLAAVDRVMRRLRQQVEAEAGAAADPLDRIALAIRAYLDFFANRPQLVELLIQERAQFKDRPQPTYFEHQEANVECWRDLYRGLIADGRVRDMPVERITDVMSDLLYGTMFTNYFAGRRKPSDVQAQDILDVVFHGILSGPERQRRGA
jgi:AcrR family transcriptional regulator